jgi:predicted nucleotidyltransferase
MKMSVEAATRVHYPARMNAEPQLSRIAEALNACRIEAVLIGNSAAALHGAPVTTLDFDFMIRETPANVERLRELAEALDGVYLDKSSPMTTLRRVENEREDLYIDFVSQADGIGSFAALRSRATSVEFGGHVLRVAALEDVLASKRAAGRPRDRAVVEILEKTLEEKRHREGGKS